MSDRRLQKLRDRLDGAGCDALLVSQLTNILYLSSFRGSAGHLLITPQRQYLITDFRYHERVRREVDPAWELVDNTGLDLTGEVLPRLLSLEKVRRLGFESEHASHDAWTRLSRLARGAAAGATAGAGATAETGATAEAGAIAAAGATAGAGAAAGATATAMAGAAGAAVALVPTRGLVEGLREVKEPGEIARIRAAVRLGERIFAELLPMIGPGVTEADLAAEVEYRARRHGATACSFPPIVASGPRAAQPHAGATREPLVPGAPLILDLGVVLDDYCSDMTRTVFFRECPPRWRAIYELVREAKDRAFASVAPGVAARAVDAVAREIIGQAGYGEQFRHGLGHGVGLPFKGGPTLNWTSVDVLRPGHVASCEPGIYLPGEGGVRIEDLFVVTESGAENLNALPTDLLVVG